MLETVHGAVRRSSIISNCAFECACYYYYYYYYCYYHYYYYCYCCCYYSSHYYYYYHHHHHHHCYHHHHHYYYYYYYYHYYYYRHHHHHCYYYMLLVMVFDCWGLWFTVSTHHGHEDRPELDGLATGDRDDHGSGGSCRHSHLQVHWHLPLQQ